MPDQPAHIFNITIGYDLGGFSARLSYLYQTDKLTGIGYDGVIPTSRLSSYTGGYGRWDLTLQQKFYQNFQFFANFNNLNNRQDQNFIGSNLEHPSYIEYYGFTMDLGIRYNL
jgi:outer membrane receptor protein involved in Fe transport